MHNRHMIGCGVMLALAFGLLIVTGGSSAGLGLVLVALICPLAMILGIKLLLGDRQGHAEDHAEPTPVERHDSGAR